MLKIHKYRPRNSEYMSVIGNCEKKLDKIGKIIVLSCVCVCVWLGGWEGVGRGRGDGYVFAFWSSIFICFFRQKATIVLHSLETRVFCTPSIVQMEMLVTFPRNG